MFARKANTVLIFILALYVSHGSLLLSSSLTPNQGHHPQEQIFRQFKRQISFGNDAADRWLLYYKEEPEEMRSFGGKRHSRFEHPGSRPPWRKRGYLSQEFGRGIKHSRFLTKNLMSHFILRPGRTRIYDVPQFVRGPWDPLTFTKSQEFVDFASSLRYIPSSYQIQCPQPEEGTEKFSCPSADIFGRYRCIDDQALCDGFSDCPNGEDEDRQSCMFYKTTKAHLDLIADAVLRWARGR